MHRNIGKSIINQVIDLLGFIGNLNQKKIHLRILAAELQFAIGVLINRLIVDLSIYQHAQFYNS